MKVLLFGGGGFIGEYLARNLRKRRECKVEIADKNTGYLDLGADVVVVLTQPGSPVSEILIPKLAGFQRLKKIVYLSTLLLYPDSGRRQDESVEPDPQTEYEKNKYGEESALSAVSEKKGWRFCVARLSNVYGDVKNSGIINYIMLSAIKGNLLIIYGDKNKKIRDYIFIEDAANLLEFLIFHEQPKPKEIFNICTGVGQSIQELIAATGLITGRKIDFETGGAILEKQTCIGENKKILELSGYKFTHNLAEGLKKTYYNYLKFYK